MGFFDFLKKAGVVKSGKQTWSGDASQKPVDDPLVQNSAENTDSQADPQDSAQSDSDSSNW
ncbi:MAG: hypothetical protein WC831_06140 [Parcubacteria group bacterium]|jgi:hypothetical protein